MATGNKPQYTPFFGSTSTATTPSMLGTNQTPNLFGASAATPSMLGANQTPNLFGASAATPAFSLGSSTIGSGPSAHPSNANMANPFATTYSSTIPSLGSGFTSGSTNLTPLNTNGTTLPSTASQPAINPFFRPTTQPLTQTSNLAQSSPFLVSTAQSTEAGGNQQPATSAYAQQVDFQAEPQEKINSYSFPSSKISKLLLDSSTLASKCCKSTLDLFSSHFFPTAAIDAIAFPNASIGYSFLSKHGIDVNESELKISKIAAFSSKEKGLPAPKIKQQEKLLLQVQRSPIEYQKSVNFCRQEAIEDAIKLKRYIFSSITSHWDACRMGTNLGQALSPIVVAGEKDGVEAPIQLPSLKSIITDHKARAFAETISELNAFRISQGNAKISPLIHFPLCNRLLSILAPFSHDPAGLREKSKPNPSPDAEFTQSAKHFFEKEFICHMDRMISQNPREAILGGRPNLIDKVRAYTNLRLTQRNHHKGTSLSTSLSHNTFFDAVEMFHGGDPGSQDNIPIYPWATLYFLIRAGAGKSHLLGWVETFESYFVRSDKYFKDALVAFAEESSSVDNLDNNRLVDFVRNEYLRLESLRDTTDPFRLLIYGLFSSSARRSCGQHFDKSALSSPPLSIISTFEDWIWYNLSILRESSLLEFRTTVQKFSASYFDSNSMDANSSSSNYFKLLFYIGLFDKGLLAMLRATAVKPTIFVEAVHVSIALLYHFERLPGLNVDIPLHILRQYVTLLTAAYSKESTFVSLEYLSIISVMPSKQETCFNLLVDWMLATSSYKAPLASISDDGMVQAKGLNVSGTCGSPSLLVVLSWRVATQLLSRAVSEDEEEAALGLFHICSSYERIFELLAKKLSDALLDGKVAPLAPSPIARQARGTLNFYRQHAPDRNSYNSPPCQKSISVLTLLLSLYDALSMQRNSCSDKALESSNLISFSSNDKFTVHESVVDANGAPSLNRHLGLILELTLSAMAELYSQSTRPTAVSTLQTVPFSIQDLKTMGRAVMLFASKFSTKIGPSYFAALTRLDAMIQ
ncbi:nuclear pore complex subunit [Mitosporidium daphniae]